MKGFVTGGNGFIGSRVVHALCQAGHEVRCLLRESSNTSRIDGLSYEQHIGDLRDARSLRKGIEGCEGVIHLASISSWSAIRSPLMREVVVAGGCRAPAPLPLLLPVPGGGGGGSSAGCRCEACWKMA